MMIIGCDFHPRFQQIAFVDRETGEYGERRLNHPEEAERFYRSLAGRQVRIGAEATGNFRWFGHLMQELGHEFLLGDATTIRAACPRRQKTDKRDARHILSMLVEDRFPVIWQPSVENDHLRQLLHHRCRLVRMRTRIKNQLDSMAKNEGLLSKRVWCAMRRKQIEELPVSGWNVERRKDLLFLLEELNKRIEPLDEAVLKEKVQSICAARNATFAALYAAEPMDAQAIFAEYLAYGRRLAPMVCDAGTMLRAACKAGERICFEGGQGSMLDIDHGTFPFVTSSSVTACGVPGGAGISPKEIGYVVGVVKCYTSRVGTGPFPTEQDNETGQFLRTRGHEFGTTTGRPRRCGWFDAVAVRYAAELSGVDELGMMLLLDGEGQLETLRICTGYKYGGRSITEFDPTLPLERVECVYEDLPAWQEKIADVKRYEDLPAAARRYVERVEQLIGRPIGLLSVGLRREQTILHNSKLDKLG